MKSVTTTIVPPAPTSQGGHGASIHTNLAVRAHKLPKGKYLKVVCDDLRELRSISSFIFNTGRKKYDLHFYRRGFTLFIASKNTPKPAGR